MPRERSKPAKADAARAADLLSNVAVGLTILLFIALIAGVFGLHTAMQRRVGDIVRHPITVEFAWPRLAANPGSATPPGAGSDPAIRQVALTSDSPAAEAPPQPQTWLSEPDRSVLVMLVTNSLTDDPFDRDALARAHDSLLETGWFERIHAIRREPRGVVRIEADWHSPAAVVRHGGTDHLVSTRAERLPLTFKPGASGLRVIQNPSLGPPERLGDPWLGGDVQAGLGLLALLQNTPFYHQVAGIDVKAPVSKNPKEQLVIITDRGNRVVWGSSPLPGEASPSEPSTDYKLRWLNEFYTNATHARRIDANQPTIRLDMQPAPMIDLSAQPVTPPVLPQAPGTVPGVAPGSDTGKSGPITPVLDPAEPAANPGIIRSVAGR